MFEVSHFRLIQLSKYIIVKDIVFNKSDHILKPAFTRVSIPGSIVDSKLSLLFTLFHVDLLRHVGT